MQGSRPHLLSQIYVGVHACSQNLQDLGAFVGTFVCQPGYLETHATYVGIITVLGYVHPHRQAILQSAISIYGCARKRT